MNERIKELAKQATKVSEPNDPDYRHEIFDKEKFAQLVIRECANELREAEKEADRAYKVGEVSERNTFNGYDFAEMLLERFGVE